MVLRPLQTLVVRRRTGGPLMAKQQHTHTKDCPDYKAAAQDRAKHAAAALERELAFRAAAHAEWLDAYYNVK
jgi:hypothetical protein